MFTYGLGGRVGGPFIAGNCMSPRCFYSERGRATGVISLLAGRGGVTLVSPHELNGASLLQRYFKRPRVGRRCRAFVVSVCTADSMHSFIGIFNGTMLSRLHPGKGSM